MEKAGETFPPEETEPAGHTLKGRPAGFTMVTLSIHEFMIRGHCRENYLLAFFFFVAFFLVTFFLVDRVAFFFVAFFLVTFFLVDRVAFFFVAFFLVAFFLVDRVAFFFVAFFLVAFFVAFFFAIGYGSFPECALINGPAIPLGRSLWGNDVRSNCLTDPCSFEPLPTGGVSDQCGQSLATKLMVAG
jgi:hypothetical protein